jgi:hypothetical protein
MPAIVSVAIILIISQKGKPVTGVKVYPETRFCCVHRWRSSHSCSPPKVNRWSNPITSIAEIRECEPSSSSEEEFSDARDELHEEAQAKPKPAPESFAIQQPSAPPSVKDSAPTAAVAQPAPVAQPAHATPAAPVRRKSGLSEVAVPTRRLPTVLTSKRKLPDPKVHVFEAMLREEQVCI